LGIDTPESKTSNKEEKIRGLLSKKKLQEMLPINEIVKIITIKSDSTIILVEYWVPSLQKKKLM
jgi:endonuclease YncB( thermonuclease family)